VQSTIKQKILPVMSRQLRENSANIQSISPEYMNTINLKRRVCRKRRGFLVPDLLNNNLSAATSVHTSDISSYKNEVVLISFLGRFVYTYDVTVYLTASFRRDGSSIWSRKMPGKFSFPGCCVESQQ
jgi:hypothetical protein